LDVVHPQAGTVEVIMSAWEASLEASPEITGRRRFDEDEEENFETEDFDFEEEDEDFEDDEAEDFDEEDDDFEDEEFQGDFSFDEEDDDG
jgi:hypothetical protein